MGVLTIVAECECGFETDKMPFGCGMMTVDTIDYFPALCMTCGELASVNIKEIPNLCSKCFSKSIKIYNSSEMRGNIVEIDLSSDKFYRSYELWNETLEMMAESDGEEFVPVDLEQFKVEYIERYEKHIEEARDPIFIHYNYCPRCKKKNFDFLIKH